jgi:hypothetical protein
MAGQIYIQPLFIQESIQMSTQQPSGKGKTLERIMDELSFARLRTTSLLAEEVCVPGRDG